ncbi:MMPL family transporter [Flaviflexus equikiangi]|uniref:MMPL family transporter n=1 Tax=Flaviflexus equikiangi TaxID=2758573 RepID=A0ABS2TIC0_9ACTO|nr:MMPL family transporter [Flaviflexus equikiangi]MBM9433049.1 MMPL family transporter [Flaviflexus equikiangi]
MAISSHRPWLVSRRGAWSTLGLSLVVLVLLFGLFGGAEAPPSGSSSPASSESQKVSDFMAELPDAGRQSVLLVATRDDGGELTQTDLTSFDTLAEEVTGQPGELMVSEDGQAAAVSAPITVGQSSTETADVVNELRAGLEDAPEGMSVCVTGGPAFGADIASSFDGADITLLAVTIAIVAILLIATYRSPILWLLPLTVVTLADGLAGRVTAAAGQAWNLEFDAGIVSVLVFGAGTNYALLLISRYREELTKDADHRSALGRAWRLSMPAILASNVTVVISLLTLALSVIPGTRGLGLSSALGLLIALAAVTFVLPPVLAIAGRRAFWPFVPKPGSAGADGGVWRTVATRVSARPARALTAGLVLLGVMATGLIGTSVGLDQVEKFRVPSESAEGLEVFGDHFPAGQTQPIFVLAETEHAAEVMDAVSDVAGVSLVHPTADHNGRTVIMVTSEYAPSTQESLAQIGDLREAAHAVEGGDALVGGAVASDVDTRAGTTRDLRVIAPLILGANFLVLVLLLRSFTAPAILILVNLASSVAAIGAGAWLGRILFDQQALDLQVPLLAFLFLVALGIDYTIFLVHRARTEAAQRGTRAGIVESVAHTGSVITSAGIVLAGVFAALGVLPLVTLGQLGLIVGLGIIVDTLVVRTIIVPAIFTLVGDAIWWPGGLRTGEGTHESRRVTPRAG